MKLNIRIAASNVADARSPPPERGSASGSSATRKRRLEDDNRNAERDLNERLGVERSNHSQTSRSALSWTYAGRMTRLGYVSLAQQDRAPVS